MILFTWPRGPHSSCRYQPTLQLQDIDPVVYVPRTPASGPAAWLLVRGAPSATAVASVLVVVAAVASVWPARRATRVRPAMALRAE